jgi:hypothetical protein
MNGLPHYNPVPFRAVQQNCGIIMNKEKESEKTKSATTEYNLSLILIRLPSKRS